MILSLEPKANWSPLAKVVFRFAFCYFTLYILLSFTSSLFQAPIRWIGDVVLNIDYKYDTSGYGSGDNTFSYVSLFTNFLLSSTITLVWSLIDRKRASYNGLFYWFTVCIRIYIIYFMLIYGFIKVFKSQFPYPSLTRMLQPLGEFSPMGLAWTYMGYSNGFNIFTGALEIIAGLLLIPRRSQSLGALMVAGVMTHVAVMNFMFDIPVKIFSLHLVLMALLIFSTDLKRILNVFFLNKPTTKYHFYRPTKEPFYNMLTFWIKTSFLLIVLALIIPRGFSSQKKWGDNRPKPHLYGIWETSYFIKNNDTLPPLTTNSERWRYLIIDYKDRASIKTMTGKVEYYDFITDSIKNKISIYKRNADTLNFNFNFKHPNEYYLELEGTLENDSLHMIFNKVNHKEFLLNSRGFNWINERPYNR